MGSTQISASKSTTATISTWSTGTKKENHFLSKDSNFFFFFLGFFRTISHNLRNGQTWANRRPVDQRVQQQQCDHNTGAANHLVCHRHRAQNRQPPQQQQQHFQPQANRLNVKLSFRPIVLNRQRRYCIDANEYVEPISVQPIHGEYSCVFNRASCRKVHGHWTF